MIETLVLAVVLFATTNIDDIFVLLCFFADRRIGAREIIIGQYLGMVTLVALSMIASLVSLVLSPEQVGLLGCMPIIVGLWKIYRLWRPGEDTPAHGGSSVVLSVAAVTIANGGDNIGVYTPVFATQPPAVLAVFAIVFAIMTALWLAIGYALVDHSRLGAPIRRYGHRIVPVILIGLGVLILHEAGSLQFIQRLLANLLL